MDQPTTANLDPKTAKVIDEMEKSLQNMEKSLGRDHLLIAKILDSYAKILRQNKLRPVDAVNMEARARAIRAKHNQKEAQDQSEDLGPIVAQKKRVRVVQVKAGIWAVCLLAVLGIFVLAVQMLNSSAKHMKLSQSDSKEEFVTVYEKKDKVTGELVSKTTVTESVERPQLTIFEIAGKLMQIKSLAKQQLLVGQKQEKDGDLAAARETYRELVDAEEEAAKLYGRQAHSLEIADCFEHYAKLIEADDPEEAKNCLQFATLTRACSTK